MRVILLVLIGFSLSFSNMVIDSKTGLMWQDDSRAKTVERDWEDAKEYCQNLELAGYDDWFLPTVEQLLTITDKNRYSPAIKKEFQNSTSSLYWSSSSNMSNSKNAWNVYFKYGNSNYYSKSDKYSVRCARSGQSDSLPFDSLVSKIVKQELENIPKPPTKLNLVKDEFETTKEFEKRVKKTKAAQKKKIAAYKRNYANSKAKAEKRAIKKALEITYGKPLLSNLKYDADNGYFIANISFEGKEDFKKKVAIKVDRKSARSFKSDFYKLKPQAIFDYENGSVKLKDIRIPYKKKSYTAQFTDLDIDDTRVAVNISNDISIDPEIRTDISVGAAEVASFDPSKLRNFNELDTLLKKSKAAKTDRKKWLFAVGIQKYEFTDNITYAKRSGEMFVKTVQKRLGVPKRNSFVMIDSGATQAKIKTNFKKMLKRVKGGDTIYFYYNGHGVPVPSLKNEPFMLTSDSEPDFVADEKFFSLQNIYSQLSSSKAEKVVAFVDSCFSGVTDGKAVLKGVAATKMKAKSVKFDKEKMVVISAGKAHQYSNGFDRKGHRLFSFYVMKNIIEGKTEIKDLYKNTKNQTYDTSLEEYGDLRVQEPTIEGNFRLSL